MQERGLLVLRDFADDLRAIQQPVAGEAVLDRAPEARRGPRVASAKTSQLPDGRSHLVEGVCGVIQLLGVERGTLPPGQRHEGVSDLQAWCRIVVLCLLIEGIEPECQAIREDRSMMNDR